MLKTYQKPHFLQILHFGFHGIVVLNFFLVRIRVAIVVFIMSKFADRILERQSIIFLDNEIHPRSTSRLCMYNSVNQEWI